MRVRLVFMDAEQDAGRTAASCILSEGNVVVGDSRVAKGLVGVRDRPGNRIHRRNAGFGPLGPASQQNHLSGDHFRGPALVPVPVRPFARLDAPFHINLAALGKILFRQIRQPPPGNNGVPLGAFLAGSVFIGPVFAGRKAKGRDRSSVRAVSDFGILAQTSNQKDFVERAHGCFSLSGFPA